MVSKVGKVGHAAGLDKKTRVGTTPPQNIRKAKDKLSERLNKGSEAPKYAIGFTKGKEGGFQLEVRTKSKKDLASVPDEFDGFKINKIATGAVKSI